MIERVTEWPRRGRACEIMEGSEMSENTVSATAPAITIAPEVTELVTGSLLPRNSVGEASVDFYRAALESAGVDPESLSFAEVVEVTRRLYGPSADYRRDRADIAKAAKEAERAAAKAKRDAERAKRAEAEIAKIEARLAALKG